METTTEIQYNFERIKWQVLSRKWYIEWLLVVSDERTLIEYLKYRFSILMVEYQRLKKKNYAFHCTNQDEYAIERIFQCNYLLEPEPKRKTIDDMILISKTLLNGYIHFFKKNGIVFITENNVIRPIVTHKRKSLKKIILNKMEWPTTEYTEEDIKITKWPKGKHYYAKIGTIEVVDDYGNIKWSTYEMAEDQAKLFLKNMENDEKTTSK